MDILYTIEKEMARNRRMFIIICTIVVIMCSSISCYCIYQLIENNNTIFALDNQNNIIVFNRVAENRKAEAVGHFRAFHELFFNLPPEGEIISENIEKHAFELIDNSAKIYYDKLKQDQFFNSLIVMSATQSLKIDSIKVSNNHPYMAYLWGKIYIIGKETIIEKSLITTGVLRNTNKRSTKNPAAFIIEKLKIIENKIIKEYKRR